MLYSGDFCSGWYEQWVEELRRYYQGLYEECLALAAEYRMISGSVKQAIECYEKLIDIDFFNEQYHRAYMKACASLKRLDDIVKDYTALQQRLRKELSVEPEQETARLYKEVTG